MPRQDHSFRIQYYDTDQMGVAHHAAYFHWMETARTEWFRKAGLCYRDFEEQGFMLPVVEASFQYGASARYDQEAGIECTIASLKRSTLVIHYELFIIATGEKLGSGSTRHACVSSETMKITRFPNFAMAILEGLPKTEA